MDLELFPHRDVQPQYRELVTAVIPAKDEAQTIGLIVSLSLKYCQSVLVLDGNSRDDTAKIAKELGAMVLTDSNSGKGAAMRASIQAIKTPITVFLDADGSHDPKDIPALVQPIAKGEADHVTGSRLMGGSSELHGGFDEFLRLTGSSFITAWINWRFKVRLSDSQNGFRAISTDLLRTLDLRECSTTIEQEMIMKTLRLGYRMGEVPSHEYKRKFGISHISLAKAWPRYVYTLLRYSLI